MPPRAKARAKAGSRTRSTSAKRRSTRAAIVVEDLADFNESINLLTHGDSGVGKTPFAAMAPNAVILSTEKGSISAKRFGSTAKLIRATSWIKMEAALDYLEQHKDDFDWVILDSLTKMQQLLLRHLLEINVEEGTAKADLDLPALADHQKWQNMFKRFVDRIVDMQINSILIATSMHKEDAEGEDLVMPDVQGKDYAISNYVCAQMDGVYYLKVFSPKKDGEPYWRLLTQKKPPYFAKDRFRALPRVIEYPYMPRIIELIQESLGDGEPLHGPEMMRALETRRSKKVDDDDLEEPDDDEEEPEEPEEAPERPAATRSTRKRPEAGRGQRRPARAAGREPEDDTDEEEEPEEPPKRPRPAARAAKAKTPAARSRRPASVRKMKAQQDEDDLDEFDPDDGDIDLDDEDEE
jgi:hypothetical protein